MAWFKGQTGGTQAFTLHGKGITSRPADTADKMLEMKYQSSFRLRETCSIVSHNGSTPSPMPEQNQSITITIHFISLSRFYFITRFSFIIEFYLHLLFGYCYPNHSFATISQSASIAGGGHDIAPGVRLNRGAGIGCKTPSSTANMLRARTWE